MLSIHATIRCLRHVLVALAVLCGCGRSAGGAPPQAATPQTPSTPGRAPSMRWAGKLPAGRVMEIHVVEGKVRALPATDDVGVVEATVADGRPPLRIVEDEHGVSVRTEDREERCGDQHPPLPPVDVVVHVPAGVRLVARTVGGAIELERVAGPFDLAAVDGGIDLRSVSSGRARTTNGAIHASFAGGALSDDSDLSTVNGSLDVVLPSIASAEVAARSVNGTVSVDFPVAGAIEPHGARGTIGHGGRTIRLRTVNGSIHVARGA